MDRVNPDRDTYCTYCRQRKPGVRARVPTFEKNGEYFTLTPIPVFLCEACAHGMALRYGNVVPDASLPTPPT